MMNQSVQNVEKNMKLYDEGCQCTGCHIARDFEHEPTEHLLEIVSHGPSPSWLQNGTSEDRSFHEIAYAVARRTLYVREGIYIFPDHEAIN